MSRYIDFPKRKPGREEGGASSSVKAGRYGDVLADQMEQEVPQTPPAAYDSGYMDDPVEAKEEAVVPQPEPKKYYRRRYKRKFPRRVIRGKLMSQFHGAFNWRMTPGFCVKLKLANLNYKARQSDPALYAYQNAMKKSFSNWNKYSRAMLTKYLYAKQVANRLQYDLVKLKRIGVSLSSKLMGAYTTKKLSTWFDKVISPMASVTRTFKRKRFKRKYFNKRRKWA